ncbi:hypothetical protein PINS_up015249 [Pythium insidiosum]|nr:hypothetical protein PINS_up015249 [Pythium insidiosum]
MDMNSLLPPPHGALDGFRGPATSVPSFQQSASSLPGLRKHLPSLPIRLAALSAPSPAAPNDLHSGHPRRPDLAPLNAPSSHGGERLAPLRFIIPSTHCSGSVSSFPSASVTSDSNVNIRPAVAPSLPSAAAFASVAHQSHDAFHSTHDSVPRAGVSMDMSMLSHDPVAHDSSEHLAPDSMNALEHQDQGKTKKSPGRRSRAVKNPNRSTKSKARPGLRKGKWTEEEERYAAQLTMYFKEGLLPIARGTMLRLYLSQKLNCEPMRITKKFTGGECIGKQVFRPCSPTPEAKVRRMQAQLELVALEAAFIKRLKRTRRRCRVSRTATAARSRPAACCRSSRRSVAHETTPMDRRTRTATTVASRRTRLRTVPAARPRKLASGTWTAWTTPAPSGCCSTSSTRQVVTTRSPRPRWIVQRPHRPRWPAPAQPGVSSEPEPESESEDRVSSSLLRSSEELASSPTKRMRTLSISNSVADVTTPKRSRVGSFSVMSMSCSN